MTHADIYRKAAELLAHDFIPGNWSCWAIEMVLKVPCSDGENEKHPLVKEYEKFFKPDNAANSHAWGLTWDIEDRDECRILALCFMAAISESLHR